MSGSPSPRPSHDRIEWYGPHLTNKELDRLRECLASGYINDGPLARDFERGIAELVGTQYAVAVTSGTAAIALSLLAAGIGPGMEVLVPDLTFIATANAVRLVGAQVKLVDVESFRFCINPDLIEAVIGPTTRAVVTVDVNGRGADYGRIESICRDRGLILICDAAEGLGSCYAGRKVGSFGLAGCFSFSANKTIAAGQGGMIVTNDRAMHDSLRELKDQGRRNGGSGGDDIHPVLGFNFKFTDLQAAVALAQFDEIQERLNAAVRRDQVYAGHLANQPGLTLPSFEQPGEVRQWTDILVQDRPRVVAALEAANIGCRAFWHPLHHQGPYLDKDDATFPNTLDISRRGLWLPSRFDMTEAEIERVCSVIVAAIRA
ncbi:MAG: DegT/DnrJ/EryC1/StrS family aminotransferase [Xanthobacteraceae bacterium]